MDNKGKGKGKGLHYPPTPWALARMKPYTVVNNKDIIAVLDRQFEEEQRMRMKARGA